MSETSEATEQTAEATEQTAGYMERPPETRINPAPKENPSHWMKPAEDLFLCTLDGFFTDV